VQAKVTGSLHVADLSWNCTVGKGQGDEVVTKAKQSWRYQQGPALCSCNYFPKIERQGDQIVRVIGSVPERFSLIYVTLVSAIANSKTNVDITEAYFAPDHQMLHALERAARRARNNEVNAIVLSHSFGDEMSLMFRNDLENSKQIELDQWEHRPSREHLDEIIARIAEPLL